MNRNKNITRFRNLGLFLCAFIAGYYFVPASRGTTGEEILCIEGGIMKVRDELQCSALIHDKFQAAEKAVVIVITSPGGSWRESKFIYDELMYCKAKYNKKLVVFIPTLAMSGAMLISSAGDEVVASPEAWIGSIGVLGEMFTLADLNRVKASLGIAGSGYRNYGSRSIQEKLSKEPLLSMTPTEEIKEEFQKDIDRTEAEFFKIVSSKQGVCASIIPLLKGEFFKANSKKSIDLNFVDELMSEADFLAYARKQGYLSSKDITYTNLLTFTY